MRGPADVDLRTEGGRGYAETVAKLMTAAGNWSSSDINTYKLGMVWGGHATTLTDEGE